MSYYNITVVDDDGFAGPTLWVKIFDEIVAKDPDLFGARHSRTFRNGEIYVLEYNQINVWFYSPVLRVRFQARSSQADRVLREVGAAWGLESAKLDKHPNGG